MSGGGLKNLYFAKWNRLPEVLGYKITFLDFTLREKEHTGAKFDFEFVKGFGMMTKMGYNINLGLYEGGMKAFGDKLGQQVAQVGNEVYNFFIDVGTIASVLLTGDDPATVELNATNSVIDWSTIAIGNLHFKKELYVSSDNPNGTTDPIAGARTTVVNKSDEHDYINAKRHANAKRARASFYPQTWNMRTIGDVRMRFGKSFKIKGDRVPNKDAGQDYITMVCKSVTHTIDHSGYHMTVMGQKKFVTIGGT